MISRNIFQVIANFCEITHRKIFFNISAFFCQNPYWKQNHIISHKWHPTFYFQITMCVVEKSLDSAKYEPTKRKILAFSDLHIWIGLQPFFVNPKKILQYPSVKLKDNKKGNIRKRPSKAIKFLYCPFIEIFSPSRISRNFQHLIRTSPFKKG